MKDVIILYMKYIVLLLVIVGCAQVPPKTYKDDLVSVDAAINHAYSSYLKGCVDAFHDLKIPGAFASCKDKALIHRRELDSFMGQDL